MSDPPRRPVTLAELSVRVAELYRVEGLAPWRARVLRLTREWLQRPDATLCWTDAAEADADCAVHLPLLGRERAPRWLGFARAPEPEIRAVTQALVVHLGRVAVHMDARLAQYDGAVPLRWKQALTPRQMQVAVRVADGHTNDQIAEALGIAPRTVVRLLQDVFKRLDYSNRGELAAERALGRPPTPTHQRIPDALLADEGSLSGSESGLTWSGGAADDPADETADDDDALDGDTDLDDLDDSFDDELDEDTDVRSK